MMIRRVRIGLNLMVPPSYVPWNGNNMKRSYDPETCHCGAKALFRHGKKGFCRAHYEDAKAATLTTNGKGER